MSELPRVPFTHLRLCYWYEDWLRAGQSTGRASSPGADFMPALHGMRTEGYMFVAC
jgi:hypothetical protein